MEKENGDDFIRRSAAFIRTNEQRLADIGIIRRPSRPPKAGNSVGSSYNLLGWIMGPTPNSPLRNAKPLVLSLDPHHLFYLLMRFEELDIDVGPLDVHVENISRPFSYISVASTKDKTDTLSIASFRSGISNLSLGVGWWARPQPVKLDDELKYLYSSYTKLPALSLHQSGSKVIAELADDPPMNNAIPLEVFKNLQSLECLDIDPRTVLGWDRLAESLRSLTIKRSGLADASDILIDAVVDDQARREGKPVPPRGRRLIHRPSSRSQRSSLHEGQDAEISGDEERTPTGTTSLPSSEKTPTLATPLPNPPAPTTPIADPSPPALSPLKWAFLKHLSFADNALTFFPTSPLAHLTSLTHLDLSSNLLISVPAGLSQLYNLVSLNLSDNMIDSVLGIYTMLGQVLVLNLSRNRLDSLCGLERLSALERVDLRNNRIEDSGEVGRLATLPNVAAVWVEGNPFIHSEEYRVKCFDYFAREGKDIILDDTPPSFYERRNITATVNLMKPPMKLVAPSPPVVAVGGPPPSTSSTPPSQNTPKLVPLNLTSPSSPTTQPVPATKPKRRIHKRLVDLDDDYSLDEAVTTPTPRPRHSRRASDGNVAFGPSLQPSNPTGPPPPDIVEEPPTPMPALRQLKLPPPTFGRHGRSPTDVFTPSNNVTRSARNRSGSATISSSSSARRARISASVYEPHTPPGENGNSSDPFEGSSLSSPKRDAEAFRAKIEALRTEVGDSWLKVLSQSQFSGQNSKQQPTTVQEVGV